MKDNNSKKNACDNSSNYQNQNSKNTSKKCDSKRLFRKVDKLEGLDKKKATQRRKLNLFD